MPLLSCGKWINAARFENYRAQNGRMDVRFCTLNNFSGSGITAVFIIFQGGTPPKIFKVSSQSRKSEFRVFSMVHLNIDNFDVLNQFQQNKVLWI